MALSGPVIGHRSLETTSWNQSIRQRCAESTQHRCALSGGFERLHPERLSCRQTTRSFTPQKKKNRNTGSETWGTEVCVVTSVCTEYRMRNRSFCKCCSCTLTTCIACQDCGRLSSSLTHVQPLCIRGTSKRHRAAVQNALPGKSERSSSQSTPTTSNSKSTLEIKAEEEDPKSSKLTEVSNTDSLNGDLSSSTVLQLPTLAAGVNWYCLSMIGLVTLIDFSPLGSILRSTSGAAVPWILAATQWGLFVGPTVNSCRSEGYNLQRTFALKGCRPVDLLASAALGASLWAVVTAAIAARVAADGGQLPSSESVVIADLLFSRPTSATEWASLLTSAGMSPGIAEELLFRGFLLTSLRQGLGRVDAVVLCGALFGLFHLSVSHFFPTTVLGIAAGASAIASGSIGGPIAVHTAHNVAALLYGGLAQDDIYALPSIIAVGSALTLLLSGTYLLMRARAAVDTD